jgi:hypothetical protein
MKLFVNGQLLSDQVGDFPDTKTVTTNATFPAVVAVSCLDTGGAAGIILSGSNNMVTDSSWRCSNTLQNSWDRVSIQLLFGNKWRKKNLSAVGDGVKFFKALPI